MLAMLPRTLSSYARVCVNTTYRAITVDRQLGGLLAAPVLRLVLSTATWPTLVPLAVQQGRSLTGRTYAYTEDEKAAKAGARQAGQAAKSRQAHTP